MSALEEYREYVTRVTAKWPDGMVSSVVFETADAAIAELEAENKRLQGIMGICSGPCHGSVGEEYIVKVHEVVAELASAKDGFWRREEECEALAERLNVAEELSRKSFCVFCQEVMEKDLNVMPQIAP